MRFVERIRQDERLRESLIMLGAALLCVGALRLMIYQWLRTHGYFYGIPWDSFTRALLSYEWSKEPFFSPPDGYWLPLQFYLVGSVFALIRSWLSTSEILVPVAINNLFFVGSIIVLYCLTLKVSQKPGTAFIACLLAGVFAGDVFVSYSALSEPMLIFFMLLASYLFEIMHAGEREKHPKRAVIVSCVVLLAAATHYIGWFLAVFFCIYFGYYFFKDLMHWRRSTGTYALAIGICAVVPILWLFNSYLHFGNPFSPLQLAEEAQARFIGELGVLERALVIPRVIVQDLSPIAVIGIVSGVFLLLKEREKLRYLFPTGAALGWIWLSTALAFSAPDQEPRYLVFVGWALCPLIALAGDYLWNAWGVWGKAAAGVFLAIILALNLQQISSFQNSFKEYVRTTAMQARHWLEAQPESALVFLHRDESAENIVIALISGHPERTVLLSKEEMDVAYPDSWGYFYSKTDPWLFITRNKAFADAAKSQGFVVKKTGKYFLISDRRF